jgi:hypothetical protein
MAALNLVCADMTSEGLYGHSPGARLTVKHNGTRRFELTARKNSPTRPTMLSASISERRGRIGIERSVHITTASSAFDFDIPAGTAHLSPPAPFSGAGSYLHPKHGHARWRGNLSVDFPGRSNFHLTGPGTHASMIRAVLNPGHLP